MLFNGRADFNEINNNITYNKGITSNASEMKEKGLAAYINKVEINSPDYLPVQKKIKSSDVTGMLMNMASQKNKFKQRALSNGRLEITWKDSTSTVTTLPIFIYKQSELSLNNKVIKPKVNEIGMPQVQSRKGKNTAILSFKTPTWFTALLYISILSWVLLIIYGVFRWVKIVKK